LNLFFALALALVAINNMHPRRESIKLETSKHDQFIYDMAQYKKLRPGKSYKGWMAVK